MFACFQSASFLLGGMIPRVCPSDPVCFFFYDLSGFLLQSLGDHCGGHPMVFGGSSLIDRPCIAPHLFPASVPSHLAANDITNANTSRLVWSLPPFFPLSGRRGVLAGDSSLWLVRWRHRPVNRSPEGVNSFGGHVVVWLRMTMPSTAGLTVPCRSQPAGLFSERTHLTTLRPPPLTAFHINGGLLYRQPIRHHVFWMPPTAADRARLPSIRFLLWRIAHVRTWSAVGVFSVAVFREAAHQPAARGVSVHML